MNTLHLLLFNLGILSMAQLLIWYPMETPATITAKAAVHAATKGKKGN